MKSKIDYEFKVIIVGDAGTGKSSMLANFTGCEIPRIYIPTNQEGCKLTHHATFKNKNICLKLWDLPGADTHRTMSSAQYFNAHGAIIVYSMTDTESLLHVSDWWCNINGILPQVTLDSLQVVVIGLKCDSNQTTVTQEQGEAEVEAKVLGCKHFVGSCNYKGSLNDMFDKLLLSMYTEAQRIEGEKKIAQFTDSHRLLSEQKDNDQYTPTTPLLGNQEKHVYVAGEKAQTDESSVTGSFCKSLCNHCRIV